MKDRISKYPGRVKLTPVQGDVYLLSRADEPEQEGTPINKLLLDHVVAAYGTTAGTASALTLAGDGGFQLTDGATIRFRLHVDSGATPTINVNGLGAKALMRSKNHPMRAGVSAGTWLSATYCAAFDFFVLQGSNSPFMRIGPDPKQITTMEWLVCGFGNALYNREWIGGM